MAANTEPFSRIEIINENRSIPSFAALTLNPFPPLGEGLGIRFPFSLKHGLSTFDDQRLTLKGWS